MRKTSIGQLVKLARQREDLSIEDLSKQTGLDYAWFERIEADDFDALPDPFYVRQVLDAYAEVTDLDRRLLLEAYESGKMLAYEEIEVDLEEPSRSRLRRKEREKRSSLALFYLVSLALVIVIGMTYYVWQFVQTSQTASPTSSYQVVNSTSSSAASESASESGSSESSAALPITIGGGGSYLTATVEQASQAVTVTVTANQTSSWISLSDTDLAAGVTLTPENPSAQVSLAPGSSTLLQLGVVQGVSVTINGQTLDLSSLTSDTAAVTITVN